MTPATASAASGLYTGLVTHVRRRPRVHALKYRIFMLLLDLDEAPALIGASRILSSRRFGLMSFRERDHGDGSGIPLRRQVEAALSAAGLEAGGAIRLLTMPRILGHGFNPISVYFCHRPDGELAAMVYEVTNTFGERHSYVAAAMPDAAVQRQGADKTLYVSPFMDMDMAYRFVVRPPDERVSIVIGVDDAHGEMLNAALTARRSPLTDANLLKAWLAHPLLTLKVVAGIHWEALRLLIKGVRYRVRPAPPRASVTVGHPACPGARHA